MVAASQASDKTLETYAESLLQAKLCPRQEYDRLEVWPLVNSRMSAYRSGELWVESPSLGGISPLNAVDPRYSGRAMFSRGVARILLYCHGLILEDPLALASFIYLSHISEPSRRDTIRAMFSAAVTSCVDIAPLVEGGVIVPYWRPSGDESNINHLRTELKRAVLARGGLDKYAEEAWDVVEAMYIDGINASLREAWRQVRSGNRSPDLSLIEEAVTQVGKHDVLAFLNLLKSWNTDTAIDNVAETVARALDDASAMGGEIDFFAPAMLFTRFLLAINPAPQDVDAASIRDLTRTEVPGLDDLLWSDVVSMRRNEDSFALWRRQVTAGLREAYTIRDQGMSADAYRCIQEALAEGRSAIRHAQTSSRFLRQLAKSSVLFVLGAVGGALAGAPGGVAGSSYGAAGAGVSAMLPAISDRKRSAPSWLRSHYVLFEKPKGMRATHERRSTGRD
jgi:hypothetical protein